MLKNTLKELPIILALSTGASILMHDTGLDRAAAAIYRDDVGVAATAMVLKADSLHPHIEISSDSGNSVPHSQARLTDDRRYNVRNRLIGNNNDFDYIWPSA